MNVYKPAKVPRAKAIPWEDSPPPVLIPEGLWNDGEIRLGMEHALGLDTESIHEITKHLMGDRLKQLPVAIVDISFPYEMPPTVYTPGCLSDTQEHQNRLLKDFATDAHAALTAHFGTDTWSGWFVAPSFPEGDDTNSTFSLGVYVDEYFLKTVVE